MIEIFRTLLCIVIFGSLIGYILNSKERKRLVSIWNETSLDSIKDNYENFKSLNEELDDNDEQLMNLSKQLKEDYNRLTNLYNSIMKRHKSTTVFSILLTISLLFLIISIIIF